VSLRLGNVRTVSRLLRGYQPSNAVRSSTDLTVGRDPFAITTTSCGSAQVSLGTSGNVRVRAGTAVASSSDTVVVGHLGETPGTAATEYPPSTVTGPRERTDEAAGTDPERPATDLDRASPHATTPTGRRGRGNLGSRHPSATLMCS
jgi:hypothetical protein